MGLEYQENVYYVFFEAHTYISECRMIKARALFIFETNRTGTLFNHFTNIKHYII